MKIVKSRRTICFLLLIGLLSVSGIKLFSNKNKNPEESQQDTYSENIFEITDHPGDQENSRITSSVHQIDSMKLNSTIGTSINAAKLEKNDPIYNKQISGIKKESYIQYDNSTKQSIDYPNTVGSLSLINNNKADNIKDLSNKSNTGNETKNNFANENKSKPEIQWSDKQKNNTGVVSSDLKGSVQINNNAKKSLQDNKLENIEKPIKINLTEYIQNSNSTSSSGQINSNTSKELKINPNKTNINNNNYTSISNNITSSVTTKNIVVNNGSNNNSVISTNSNNPTITSPDKNQLENNNVRKKILSFSNDNSNSSVQTNRSISGSSGDSSPSSKNISTINSTNTNNINNIKSNNTNTINGNSSNNKSTNTNNPIPNTNKKSNTNKNTKSSNKIIKTSNNNINNINNISNNNTTEAKNNTSTINSSIRNSINSNINKTNSNNTLTNNISSNQDIKNSSSKIGSADNNLNKNNSNISGNKGASNSSLNQQDKPKNIQGFNIGDDAHPSVTKSNVAQSNPPLLFASNKADSSPKIYLTKNDSEKVKYFGIVDSYNNLRPSAMVSNVKKVALTVSPPPCTKVLAQPALLPPQPVIITNTAIPINNLRSLPSIQNIQQVIPNVEIPVKTNYISSANKMSISAMQSRLLKPNNSVLVQRQASPAIRVNQVSQTFLPLAQLKTTQTITNTSPFMPIAFYPYEQSLF